MEQANTAQVMVGAHVPEGVPQPAGNDLGYHRLLKNALVLIFTNQWHHQNHKICFIFLTVLALVIPAI
jgi:hypothetical protein